VTYVLYLGLLALALVVSTLSAWLRLRRQRSGVIIQTLASIVSQNLPLAPAMRAAAGAERRALQRIYARLADRLEIGDELSTALRLAIPTCPGEIVGALQGAERGGTLPTVLQALAARVRREAWQPPARGLPVWYPAVLLVVLPLVVTFIFVVVVPRFRDIFQDYGTQLPDITVGLLSLTRLLGDAAPLLALAVFVAAAAMVQALIGRHFITRMPDRWQPMYTLWDTLVWGVPGLRQAARNYALGQQLLIMHAALRAGHDLPGAARQAACAAVNWHARQRLRRWADALESGADPIAAAARLGFPAPVRQALLTARTDGEPAARFEYLAGYYQALHQHWRRVLVGAVTPLMVIAWALVVGYIAVAMFLPLIALLEGVIGSIY
jgi:type II secretory pathway component PulF